PVAPTRTPAPTATERPSATPTPRPTRTPTPTDAPTASPTPTPQPELRQLTAGGCCVQPFFSPNGQQVLFIDKPTADAPAGIYGVDVTGSPATPPQLVEETIGFRSPDRNIVAQMDGDAARFTNETTGQTWDVNTGGNWPRYSPDSSRILWTAADREGPYDQRRADIHVAQLSGDNPRVVYFLYGGGFLGWLPDGERILLVGRDEPLSEQQTLLTYNLTTEQETRLVSHKRIRGIEMSPGGTWAAYFVDFADDNPDNRGLWVVSTDGQTRKKLNAPGFGAYRWQNDSTLLLIPLRDDPAKSMQLWAINVEDNRAVPLTDPAQTPFSISNGDWEVSPDGRTVVFVNSADQNIWLIELP
ncbi:MAG: hypothetical protein D6768_19045, partial [Chloroflexi bacterium]